MDSLLPKLYFPARNVLIQYPIQYDKAIFYLTPHDHLHSQYMYIRTILQF